MGPNFVTFRSKKFNRNALSWILFTSDNNVNFSSNKKKSVESSILDESGSPEFSPNNAKFMKKTNISRKVSTDKVPKYIINSDDVTIPQTADNMSKSRKWSSKIKSELCTSKDKNEPDYMNTNLKAS